MRVFLASCVILAFSAATANAAEVVVEMLSRDKTANLSNVFKPGLVRVNKGDTVKWKATQAGHNVAFVAGAVPAGVPLFSSPISKDVSFKFEKPGIYLYKCTPHLGMGMVGVVLVGNDKSNFAAVKAVYVPPLAKKRLEPIFVELVKP
ncbi:MAG: pseudoazurin [Alphaproteobacteria bacterium]|nr:pseudoazurin [Alphaproteobacteria bacterium]